MRIHETTNAFLMIVSDKGHSGPANDVQEALDSQEALDPQEGQQEDPLIRNVTDPQTGCRVLQYIHLNGYPENEGWGIIKFFRTMARDGIDAFKAKVSKITPLDGDERFYLSCLDAQHIECRGKRKYNWTRWTHYSHADVRWTKKNEVYHASTACDTVMSGTLRSGHGSLQTLRQIDCIDGSIKAEIASGSWILYAKCAYGYVIDLDKMTLEIYKREDSVPQDDKINTYSCVGGIHSPFCCCGQLKNEDLQEPQYGRNRFAALTALGTIPKLKTIFDLRNLPTVEEFDAWCDQYVTDEIFDLPRDNDGEMSESDPDTRYIQVRRVRRTKPMTFAN